MGSKPFIVLISYFHPPFLPAERGSKPEPGEVSSLNSSASSKKDDSLKRDSHELNDSEEEEEGDLLEDEDEVSSVDEELTSTLFAY